MSKFSLFLIIILACGPILLLLKIILKKIFSKKITFTQIFNLWIILALIIAVIFYACYTDEVHNYFREFMVFMTPMR